MGKANYDIDEVIYITEILLTYFNSFKEEFCDEISDEDSEIINNEENDDSDDDNNINKKECYNSLIMFMNKYQIRIDDLENILKIEKLNKVNEKKKKNFTLKIKKEISSFLEYSS